jgi:putative heme-binding domain-containing protein
MMKQPINDRFGRALTAIVLLLWFNQSLFAQSLTDKLTAEPPDRLLLDANERGDIVRGAILFHQGNIACAKCHRPVDESDRIGPNLSRLADDVTDQSIIDSILHPSTVIAKEYRTSLVLDVDGRIYQGLIVKQNDESVVLRDAKDVSKLITIDRQDIEEISEGSNSSMPNALADQLKDRQQFLDLLRYVLDLRARGTDADIANSSAVARRELTPGLSGLVSFRKYNCGSCHDDQGVWENGCQPNAPNLKWSARHLNPDYLVKFITDPQQSKPGTSMPRLMFGWDAKQREDAAEAIVSYLVSLAESDVHQPSGHAVDAGSVQRGHSVFHEIGCVACHSPRDANGIETPLKNSAHLRSLREKYSMSSLIAFLEDPHAARPHGLMPNMRLTHREAIDVSAFLLQTHQYEALPSIQKPAPNAGMIRQGRLLFRSLNCNRCHQGIDDEPAKTTFAKRTDLNPKDGCLAEEGNGDWPQFHFTSGERSNLRAALHADLSELSVEQQIDLNLTYFNCSACHDRNDLGGVRTDRRVHFQTTNLNLGEQGRIPPTLTGVGAKLKRKWMRDVLVNGRSVRPYMKTRMPQYGEANIGQLVDLLQNTDQLEPTEFATFKDQKEMRTRGLNLVGNKGLHCVACHTYQFKISDTMPAVDLTEMAERLKKDWFYQYMLAPQKFVPNTVMPSFWPNGKAIRPDLTGTPQEQVEALWQYLIDGRQARAPRGVIRKPLEIVVKDEARMLRRSYPGIGKRGIGVGYPGGINLAFDAEQQRLATLWKGGFVDPGGVWYGQGHGKVRTLGPALSLPAGPELDDTMKPWAVDDGRPPHHRFLGYTLDEKRRPTFRYSFHDIQVEDYFAEMRSAPHTADSLRREIKLLSKEGNSVEPRFRLLSGPQVQIQSAGKLVTDGRLTIRVVSDHKVETAAMDENTPADERTQAFIPLKLSSDVTRLVLEYQWE